jgi:hypothetical protein
MMEGTLLGRASKEGYTAFLLAWTVWLFYTMTVLLKARGV